VAGPAPVCVYLYEGLGNQLFQYAAGRSLASRLGARLILDASSFRRPGERRRFVLGGYAIDAAVIDHGSPPYPILDFPGGPIRRQLRRWRRRLGDADWRRLRSQSSLDPDDPSIFPLFRERSFDYDRRFAGLHAPVSLVGHWQSEKYFAPVAAAIRSEIRLKAPPEGENARWLAAMEGPDAVCVHVRRGDYLSGPAFRAHGLCSLAYYAGAMALIRKRIGNPRFFVFSDDWDWARRHFTDSDCTPVMANGPDAPSEELRLMSACRHHIIANSSLSWWAAWLGGRAGQIVVAPQPWFASARPTPDLFPEGWSVLPRE
jgi:hypothetical protein